MTKASVIALTASVWALGAAAALALAFVTRPPAPAPIHVVSGVPNAVLVPLTPATVEPPAAMVLPPLHIQAAPIQTKVQRVAPRPEPPRPLVCSSWRALEQGVGSVQICEPAH